MPGFVGSVKSVVGGITSTVEIHGFLSASLRWLSKYSLSSLRVPKSVSDFGGGGWVSTHFRSFQTELAQKSIDIRRTASSEYVLHSISGAKSNSITQRIFPSRGPHARGVEAIGFLPPECLRSKAIDCIWHFCEFSAKSHSGYLK